MPTPRNYTGQLLDDVTGLLYYNARYYDPQVGNFTSADSVQQNAQGMNPYLYVAGNPETKTDPTGKLIYNPGSGQVAIPQSNGGFLITGYTVGWNGTFDSSETYVPPPPPPPPSPAKHGGDATVKPSPTPQNTCGPQCQQEKVARQARIDSLKNQAWWERITGDAFAAAGLIYNIMTRTSLLGKVGNFLSLASLIANNWLPDLASGPGLSSKFSQGLLQVASAIENAAGWLEGLAAIYTSASWWEQKVIDTSVSAFEVGTLGPEQIIVTALMTAARPVLGFLLDAGAQFLWARAYADQAEVERLSNE